MTSGAADLFIRAVRDGEPTCFDDLAKALAQDVEFVSAVTGPTAGAQDVVLQLVRFHEAGRFAKATHWTAPDDATVTAEFALDSFYARYVWSFDIDASRKIARITQAGIAQTELLPESPVKIGDEISTALQIARETRNPLIVAYVDDEGRPSQAPRGTVQVLSKTQLALWLHHPQGGMARALAKNANVSIHYWGGIGTAFGGALHFQGAARIEEDAATRSRVYEGAPASEQRSDPERHGCCVIIDVTEIAGFVAGTRYNMRG